MYIKTAADRRLVFTCTINVYMCVCIYIYTYAYIVYINAIYINIMFLRYMQIVNLQDAQSRAYVGIQSLLNYLQLLPQLVCSFVISIFLPRSFLQLIFSQLSPLILRAFISNGFSVLYLLLFKKRHARLGRCRIGYKPSIDMNKVFLVYSRLYNYISHTFSLHLDPVIATYKNFTKIVALS